ncbi:hypothetical protein [Scandinavium lactucae]|uniref:Uncharacterized protein n=1 Tax=Scandinavium lactucae TaxID=3095028 RepID=A0ABU4QQ54_9ENTR|nr:MULTISPECIES: hypothetical protein [unclassified Scandinavium]MDX6041434.1 hypothetical protein [Scandinavium sp. V105_6]MDX6049867.1 hypothetical protein [Scandinavium sp. V105_1]
MTTASSQTLSEDDLQEIQEALDIPLSGSADLFTAADFCGTLVSVMVECGDKYYRLALCGRLSHALTVLRQRCVDAMPDWVVSQLTVETVPLSTLPESWQDTDLLLDYAQALTLTLSGGTLLAKNGQDLAGLLHDVVYFLVDELKSPRFEKA